MARAGAPGGAASVAYFRGRWPFPGRAIVDCAATGDVASCLKLKYGWSDDEAQLAAFNWRMR
jgi:hypothetical protein